MVLPLHGSNPQYIYEALQIKQPERVIDFSVNINPLGPPKQLLKQWERLSHYMGDYPDPAGKSLRQLIATMENVTPDSLLLGNGGADLIMDVAQLLAGQRVLINQPTFSEYEKACQVHGAQVTYVNFQGKDLNNSPSHLEKHIKVSDACFICTPNNPTGTRLCVAQFEQLLHLCQQYNCLLIVDEAFYDFAEDPWSAMTYVADFEQLIVLRSLTKMYAIAGLRLGYLCANPKIVDKIKRYQPAWPVNAIALAAGEICLQSEYHVWQTQQFIARQRERLFEKLRTFGYVFSNSVVNYFLLRDPRLQKQDQLMKWLLKRGIVPRHTYNFPGLNGHWLRLAIKNEQENNELLEALDIWADRSFS